MARFVVVLLLPLGPGKGKTSIGGDDDEWKKWGWGEDVGCRNELSRLFLYIFTANVL